MSTTNGQNGSQNGSQQSPTPRGEWIARRKAEAARTGDDNFSQMHFARKGLVTEEMVFIAEREKITPELVRDEQENEEAERYQCPADARDRPSHPVDATGPADHAVRGKVGSPGAIAGS